MMMRMFKRGLALILALALICGAALAETLDEFCNAYNEFLPECFEAMDVDEETASAMVDVLSISYNEERSQNIEFPTYTTEMEQFMISFGNESDPYALFSLCVEGEKDETLRVPLLIFLTFFTIRVNAMDADATRDLMDWLLASDEGSGKEFAGYNVTYERSEDFIIVTFVQQ